MIRVSSKNALWASLQNGGTLNSTDSTQVNNQYAQLATTKYVRSKDKDGDKSLSKDEVNISPEAFKLLDKDSNGEISQTELKTYFGSKSSDVYSYYTNKNISNNNKDLLSYLVSNASSSSVGTYANLASKQFVKSNDKDADGLLTLGKELKVSDDVAKTLDANSDGKVSQTEISTLLKSHEASLKAYYTNNKNASLSASSLSKLIK